MKIKYKKLLLISSLALAFVNSVANAKDAFYIGLDGNLNNAKVHDEEKLLF